MSEIFLCEKKVARDCKRVGCKFQLSSLSDLFLYLLFLNLKTVRKKPCENIDEKAENDGTVYLGFSPFPKIFSTLPKSHSANSFNVDKSLDLTIQ